MFGQTIDGHDLFIVGLLVILEGVLSIDNALVLGLLARRLPKHQQKRALTYGLVGAFVFRFISIAVATFLLKWRWVKLAGGGYLVWVALKHFFFEEKHNAQETNEAVELIANDSASAASPEEIKPLAPTGRPFAGFWRTVIAIELTDIAFAVDSILAAIALVDRPPQDHVGPHPKLWVIVTGGMLGVILMRFAAVMFIRLLEKFPRFETSAYLLVTLIGLKLLADWLFNTPGNEHRLDFHSPTSIAFWTFWVLMAACFSVGFIPEKETPSASTPPKT